MKTYLLLSCLMSFIHGWGSTSGADTVRPEPFAPGELSVDTMRNAAPAFSPDGKLVVFHQSAAGLCRLLWSEKTGAGWSTPAIVPFSGVYSDLEPAFSPDGKYLIFASSRDQGDTGQITGWYNGEFYKRKGGRLWKVTRSGAGWGAPELLPADINSDSSVFSPAIAGNGDLYFMRAENGGKFHLYCARMVKGKYAAPEQLPFSNTSFGDYDPAVSKDGSFLIFSSGRPPAPKVTDLFIVYRTAAGWGEPKDLRVLSSEIHGIEARLSPDNKTLYYGNGFNPATRQFNYENVYIWKADISSYVKELP